MNLELDSYIVGFTGLGRSLKQGLFGSLSLFDDLFGILNDVVKTYYIRGQALLWVLCQASQECASHHDAPLRIDYCWRQ